MGRLNILSGSSIHRHIRRLGHLRPNKDIPVNTAHLPVTEEIIRRYPLPVFIDGEPVALPDNIHFHISGQFRKTVRIMRDYDVIPSVSEKS